MNATPAETFGFKRVSLENWLTPDPIWQVFAHPPFLDPADAWVQHVLKHDLVPSVPRPIRKLFEVARGTLIYRFLYYPLLTVGAEQIFRVLEAAVSSKCVVLDAPAQADSFFAKLRWLLKVEAIDQRTHRQWGIMRELRNRASHLSDQNISNLLVLDEPTNDLDLETLDLLQERLADYPGTVLLVSHDRDFLDRVVTSVIATDGNGRWIEYAGGYTDMLSQRASATRGTVPAQASAEKRSRPATEVRAQPVAKPRRISFNDRVELEALPARIAALQTQIAELNAVLADPDLYVRDQGRFGATTQALAVARDGLATAEERWLTLEMLREEIDAVERKS